MKPDEPKSQTWSEPTELAGAGVYRRHRGGARRVAAWRKLDQEGLQVGYDQAGQAAVLDDDYGPCRGIPDVDPVDLAAVPLELLPDRRPAAQPDGCLSFFPWLRISEPLEVAGFRLVPWTRREGSTGQALSARERSVAETILSPYLVSNDRSVDCCTLLSFPGRALLDVPTDDEATRAWWIAQYFAAAGLAGRKPFDTDNYCNTDNFELVIQNFVGDLKGVSYGTRRRYGRTTNGGSRDYFRVLWPQHVPQGSASLDRELAKLLAEADTQVGEDEVRRLRDAVLHFNMANTDKGDLPEHVELAWMVAAFEKVLGLEHGKEDEFRKAVVAALPVQVPKSPGQCQRLAASSPMTRSKDQMPIEFSRVADAWACSLFRQRNDFAHGNSAARNSTWDVFEHLVLGSVLFPLLLERKLRDGAFTGYKPAADPERDKHLERELTDFEILADDWFAAPVYSSSGSPSGGAGVAHWRTVTNRLAMGRLFSAR